MSTLPFPDDQTIKSRFAGFKDKYFTQSSESRIAALEEEVARLRMLVHNDPLTGALTRHGFFVHLAPFFEEILKILRKKTERKNLGIRAISMVFLDIDNFKKVNDTYGHAVGDTVLQEVVHTINSVVRDYDLVCRWGGEEIVAALLGPDEERAAQIAEKMRESIEKNVAVEGDAVTVSIGVAELSPDTEKIPTLVDRADAAMYVAKHSRGKNVVVRYSETV